MKKKKDWNYTIIITRMRERYGDGSPIVEATHHSNTAEGVSRILNSYDEFFWLSHAADIIGVGVTEDSIF